MSGRWWRAYNGARHDAKLLRLSDKHFRWWFNLICVAAERDGYLPDHADLCAEFRTSAKAMTEILDALVEARLFDHDETGIRAHNWNERQYKSDVSNERVKRYRERQRNAACNVTETPSENRVQITDTESEKVMSTPPAAAPALTEAVEVYNTEAEKAGWAKVQRLTDARRSALKARLAECGGLEGWQTAMAKAGESKFLTGKVPRGKGHENWRPDFDFFLKAQNFTKLMEGTYDDRTGAANDHHTGRDGIAADFAYAADLLRDKQYHGV